jgi:hypothetical protein
MNYFFIYKTTNLINNKEYIGIHKTNNLDDGYLGSGLALNRAIKKYGKENFKREILEFCEDYEKLLIKESEYVDIAWVNNDMNYNIKSGRQQYGILSDESKKKISDTLKKKYANGEIKPVIRSEYIVTEEQKEKISKTLKKRYKEQEHHSNGKEPWNKGKKGVQVPWNKGKTLLPITEEQKEKISNSLKKRYEEFDHHSKGKEPWNKGKKGVQVPWNKGKLAEKIECINCGRLVDKLNAKRWHFDKCKNKPINKINMKVQEIAAPEWQKSSAVNGVEFHINNPEVSPSSSHESWMKQKTEEGWRYGPVKDADKKEHPCYVPYEELPVEPKAKDYIFRQTIHSLKNFLEK